MAEYVSRRLEDLIPFFEEVKRTPLFSADELTGIVQKFRDYEYKIQRPSRTLDDILKYIDYELGLVQLIKEKRDKTGFYHKKEEMEDKLAARINSQFGSAKINFKHDLIFWNCWIKFAQAMKWWNLGSSIYKDMTNLLGKKHTFIWGEACQYEFQNCKDKLTGIDVARKLLQAGIQQNPRAVDIYVEAFTLELMWVAYLKDDKKAMDRVIAESYDSDAILDLQLARVVYNNAQKAVPDQSDRDKFKFHSRFWAATLQFPFATELQNEIVDYIQKNCITLESFEFLIKLAFQKDHFSKGMEIISQGIEKIPGTEPYDCFLKILKTVWKVKKIPEKAVVQVCKRGHEESRLGVSSYLTWALIARRCKKKKSPKPLSVVDMGLQKYPSNHKLTVKKSKFYMAPKPEASSVV